MDDTILCSRNPRNMYQWNRAIILPRRLLLTQRNILMYITV